MVTMLLRCDLIGSGKYLCDGCVPLRIVAYRGVTAGEEEEGRKYISGKVGWIAHNANCSKIK